MRCYWNRMNPGDEGSSPPRLDVARVLVLLLGGVPCRCRVVPIIPSTSSSQSSAPAARPNSAADAPGQAHDVAARRGYACGDCRTAVRHRLCARGEAYLDRCLFCSEGIIMPQTAQIRWGFTIGALDPRRSARPSVKLLPAGGGRGHLPRFGRCLPPTEALPSR